MARRYNERLFSLSLSEMVLSGDREYFTYPASEHDRVATASAVLIQA